MAPANTSQSSQVTVLGVFYDKGQVEAVRTALQQKGISDSHIRVHPRGDGKTAHEDKGFWDSLSELFTGEDRSSADRYAEATRRGGYLVQATVPESDVAEVQQVMQRYGVADIDRQEARWRQEGWTGYDPKAPRLSETETHAERQHHDTGKEVAIPVAEEQIEIGKRQVSGGGVRIVRHVTERPVEQDVSLRHEHVDVQRRSADRDLSAEEADRAFGKDGEVIEAKEMREEAVIAKKAHVTEEVVVNKSVEEENQTVRDKVRKSEVEVEKLGTNRPRGQQPAGTRR